MTSLTTRLREWADMLSRRQRRAVQIAIDIVLISLCAALAFKLRLGFNTALTTNQLVGIAAAPLISIPIFVRFGMYRAVLRYLTEMALLSIFKAVALSFLIWACLLFLVGNYDGLGAPRSVPVIYLVLLFSVTTLSRFSFKQLLYVGKARPSRRIAVYGADDHGLEYCAALLASGDVEIAALFDDDRSKHGREFHGIRVHNPALLEDLTRKLGVESVILCMPSASGRRRLEIAASLTRKKIKVQILPSISALLGGRYRVEPVENIDLSELLGRSPVPPDQKLLRQTVEDKVILVTGAGGSVGSELLKTLLANGVGKVIAIDHSEPALFDVGRSVREHGSRDTVELVLASVRDREAITKVVKRWKPDIIYHAAAYKHVGIAETNILPVFINNVIGTKVISEVALEAGVETFVLISTDKAVNPTSIMGATKRFAELVVKASAKKAGASRTKFVTVRFGNVAGSKGSVIPIFKEQITSGGPITVRGRDTNRFFMAISEACELIVQASGISQGSEVFLLQMGEPIPIYRLARSMVELSGLSVRDADNPNGDIEIEFAEMELGEKVSEELMYDASKFAPTAHPKILKSNNPAPAPENLLEAIDELHASLREELDLSAARKALMTKLAALERGEIVHS